jgi:O-antigen/teichoic acid export membrane protein
VNKDLKNAYLSNCLKIEKDSKYLYNNASFLSVASKVGQLMCHGMTLLLITFFFTLEEQGLFFVFYSLIAIQAFVELGIGSVIQNFTSHEVATFKRDDSDIKGASARFAYVFKVGCIWFSLGSLILFAFLVFFGNAMLQASGANVLNQENILLLVIGFACALTASQVFWATIIGCGWTVQYFRFKIIQLSISNILFWLMMALGTGLWSLVVFLGLQAIIAAIYVVLLNGNFFKLLFKENSKNSKISFLRDLFPFQSRLSVSFISGYFAFNIQVPLTSLLFGIETAAKVGMSWHIAGVVSMVTHAFLIPYGPKLAMLAENKNYASLASQFSRIFRHNILIAFGLSFIILLIFWGASILVVPTPFEIFFARNLSVEHFVILLIGQTAVAAVMPYSFYLRAHKEEPIAHISMICGLLTIALSYFLCLEFGSIGISLGFMVSQLITLPFVAKIYRQRRVVYESLAG